MQGICDLKVLTIQLGTPKLAALDGLDRPAAQREASELDSWLCEVDVDGEEEGQLWWLRLVIAEGAGCESEEGEREGDHLETVGCK